MIGILASFLVLVEMSLVIPHLIYAGFGLRFTYYIVVRKYPRIAMFMSVV